jgi:hypothetical protein
MANYLSRLGWFHSLCGIFLVMMVGCRESHQPRSITHGNNPQYMEIVVDTITATNCFFKIRLHNNSEQRVSIRSAELPWNRLVVVLVDPNGKVVPKSDYEGKLIRDWAGEKEVIEPGHFLESRVSLHDLFYETAIPFLRNSDLVMFWTYRLQPLDHEASDRVGGYLTISRQSSMNEQ